MTYKELKQLYREDCAVYYRTLSLFHLGRAKLCEQAIVDAITNRHSDCHDTIFTSLLTDFKLGDYESRTICGRSEAYAPGAESLFTHQG